MLLVGRVMVRFEGFRDRFKTHWNELEALIEEKDAETGKVVQTYHTLCEPGGYFLVTNVSNRREHSVVRVRVPLNGETATISSPFTWNTNYKAGELPRVRDLGTTILIVSVGGQVGIELDTNAFVFKRPPSTDSGTMKKRRKGRADSVLHYVSANFKLGEWSPFVEEALRKIERDD